MPRNLILGLALALLVALGARWLFGGGNATRSGAAAPAPAAPSVALTEEEVSAPRANPTRQAAGDESPETSVPAPQLPAPPASPEPAPLAQVEGRVRLADGTSLPGVTVRAVGGERGTQTQREGSFLLHVAAGVVLDLEVLAPPRVRASGLGLSAPATPLPVVGPQRFVAGERAAELLVRAARVRVFGESQGAPVSLTDVAIHPLSPAGELGPAVGSGPLDRGSGHWDVVAPAGEQILIQATHAGGLLAALILTPPDGGSVATTARDTIPGTATLEVSVDGDARSLQGQSLVLALRSVTSAVELEAALPADRLSSWPGLLPGRYRAAAFLQRRGDSGEDWAAILPETEFELRADERRPLRFQLAPAGGVVLQLPGPALDLGPFSVSLETRPAGGTVPVSFAPGPNPDELRTEGGLLPGSYRLELHAGGAELWSADLEVTAGELTRLVAEF